MPQTMMVRTRVLCVDDRADNVAAMRMIIDSEPSMECVGSLGSADHLVEQVRGRDPRPDVVVLDATMPGRDPMDAMRELAVECPSTRTIIYSGYEDSDLIERAMAAGAWGCVSKNASPEVLLRAVRDVAGGSCAFPPRE